jgi:CheY-like chemotaxis protein
MTTILLVDDAPDVSDVIVALLTDEGFEVDACGRAEEALARLELYLPDLLMLDGRLPTMSGWECLDRLRGSAPTERLPVLMLTAALDDLQRNRRAPDSCTTYLAKPFDIDELLEAIRQVIETCRHEPVAV